MFPLPTVIIITLIAFLVGSLLWSLLSLADLIYVVKRQSIPLAAGVRSSGFWR
jgi:hypothetical protein